MHRIGRAVAAFERGDRDMAPIQFPMMGGDGGEIEIVTFAGAWAIGSKKTCTIKNTSRDIEVENLFHNVGVDCGQRHAAVFMWQSKWYLLVPQCG